MNSRYKQNQTSSKGFTIIEVVLVLAIAGLIFLMVFIALPALQRGQRDAQRKQDLSRVSVQMTNLLASSKGQIPQNEQDMFNFVKNYLRRSGETSDDNGNTLTDGVAGTDYKDPDGSDYTVGFAHPGKEDSNGLASIGYYPEKLCDANSSNTDGVSDTTSAPRDYALTIKLESQNIPFCIDNKS